MQQGKKTGPARLIGVHAAGFEESYERDIDDADVAEQLADDDHDTRHEIPYSGWAVRS